MVLVLSLSLLLALTLLLAPLPALAPSPALAPATGVRGEAWHVVQRWVIMRGATVAKPRCQR